MKLNILKPITKEYYEDSKGRYQGKYKSWHSNGQKWVYCFYKSNKLEGEYKSWYSTGQLQEHCFYKNDQWEGEYEWWNIKGKLLKHCYYKNGKKITKEEFLKLKIEKILK